MTTEYSDEQINQMVDQIVDAHERRQPFPHLQSRYPGFDLASAYEVQTAYVRRRVAHEAIGGFKAGLTSPEAQEHYGFPEPVAGVLWAAGRREAGATIAMSDFGYLVIDQEIAYEIAAPINEPLPNVEEFRNRVGAVRPAFELGDAASEDDFKHVRMLDLVAENCGSAQYVVGDATLPHAVDLSNIELTTYKDGERINHWQASTAGHVQWEDALWLANRVIQNGWSLEPGHILISGALGTFIGAPGTYEGHFGTLGNLGFRVV